MLNTNLTLQCVLDQFLGRYQTHHTLTPAQARVCDHMQACRTEALGAQRWHCDHCAYDNTVFHSCRDRHCPQCQWQATQAWRDKQCEQVLPVTYFHLVFTLPHQLNGWVALHPQGHLPPVLCGGVGNVRRLWPRPQTLRRSIGYDRGAAYLGTNAHTACASSLPGARRCLGRQRPLAGGERPA